MESFQDNSIRNFEMQNADNEYCSINLHPNARNRHVPGSHSHRRTKLSCATSFPSIFLCQTETQNPWEIHGRETFALRSVWQRFTECCHAIRAHTGTAQSTKQKVRFDTERNFPLQRCHNHLTICAKIKHYLHAKPSFWRPFACSTAKTLTFQVPTQPNLSMSFEKTLRKVCFHSAQYQWVVQKLSDCHCFSILGIHNPRHTLGLENHGKVTKRLFGWADECILQY